MSFARLPDNMAQYATYELAELLAQLTAAQRGAIDRIVQHVYIDNRPWADLFRGEDKICAEVTFYRRGFLDEETGEMSRVGWSHQPIFQKALQEAVRLALQAGEREQLHHLQKAKRRAVEKAKSAVDTWVGIMEDTEFALRVRRMKAADRVKQLAFHNEGTDEDESSGAAGDWWGAAIDE